MTEERRYLTRTEMYRIPQADLPLLTVTYGIGAPIATAIVALRGGLYNHLMWMHKPKRWASQGGLYSELHLNEYMKAHSIKLWTNINWTAQDKKKIVKAINRELNRNWWCRIYDGLGCICQVSKYTKWIQIPGLDICSDKADYLKLVDKRYNVNHPTPAEVNQWLKDNYDRDYRVYARYRPD